MADHSLIDSEFLGQLEQLRLHFRNRATGQSGGGRQSRQVGVSTEFSDFREYRLGDDVRRVDWNAYARFDKLILKLFLEERQMHIRFLIDQSASMQMMGKGLMAKRLALAMSYLALGSYDQISITPIGEKPEKGFGPVSGKGDFMRAVQYLESVEECSKTTLYASITNMRFQGAGMCYVFTDGFSQDSIADALAYLRYNKQKTTVVHILSSEELEPKYDGEVRLIDAETEAQREIQVSVGLMKAYQETLKSFCTELKESCHRYGFAYELIPSDMDLRQAVLERLIK